MSGCKPEPETASSDLPGERSQHASDAEGVRLQAAGSWAPVPVRS